MRNPLSIFFFIFSIFKFFYFLNFFIIRSHALHLEKISMCFLKINMLRFCFYKNTKHFSKNLLSTIFFNGPHRKYFSKVDPTESNSQLSVISKTFSNQKDKKHFSKHLTNIAYMSLLKFGHNRCFLPIFSNL